MAIDYGKGSGLAFPKGRVKALDKRDQKADLEAKDKKENAKAKQRANGSCEVREQWSLNSNRHVIGTRRCANKDTQTHHLIGGIGRRNKGKSILAEHKLRVCTQCHADITANILKPTTDTDEAANIRYWRAR